LELTTLYDGWLARIAVDGGRKAVWLERKNEPVRTVTEALRELDAMREAMLGIPSKQMALIVDTRSTLGRNDDEWEATVLPAFHSFTQRFERVGVLVATSTGEMQMARLVKDKGLGYRIFRDEAKARAFAGIP
jgi:hypothetical protein